MHILRVLLQKQSQLRQKLQYESSKVKNTFKSSVSSKNINNCEYQKITITKQIKNRLTRTKSHFGDLAKAPPTLKSSCFFHIKLF